MGVSLSLLLFPGIAEGSEDDADASLRAEFTKRFEALDGRVPLVLMDCDVASESPELVKLAVARKFGKRISDQGAFMLANTIVETARDGDGAFAGMGIVHKAESGEPMSVAYAGDLPDAESLESLMAPVVKSCGRPLRKDVRLSRETMARGTLYHEIFGHCTQPFCGFLSKVAEGERDGDGQEYVESLDELRADMARMAGLAREAGNTEGGRAWAHVRRLSLGFGDLAYIYAHVDELDKMNDIIDAELGSPGGREKFLRMDDVALIEFINSAFIRLAPDRETYERRRAALSNFHALSGENREWREDAKANIAGDAELAADIEKLKRDIEVSKNALLEPNASPSLKSRKAHSTNPHAR